MHYDAAFFCALRWNKSMQTVFFMCKYTKQVKIKYLSSIKSYKKLLAFQAISNAYRKQSFETEIVISKWMVGQAKMNTKSKQQQKANAVILILSHWHAFYQFWDPNKSNHMYCFPWY